MVDPLVLLTAIVLGAVALISGLLAFRYPVAFRVAHRNIRRARARSILVILGLLVGTAIISGSLVVGDTVQTINVHYTYLAVGYTDEGIYTVSPSGGYAYFPHSVALAIANASTGNSEIAGVAPMILDHVQVFDHATGVPQTNLNLIGSDPATSAALGTFTTTAGASLAGPGPGQILLDRLAAADLNASVGDSVTVYGAHGVVTTLQGIVEDDTRGGVLTAGLSGGNVFADLATAQQIMNASGFVNFIAVTNTGSLIDGAALSGSVSAALNRTLAATPGTTQLGVHTILQTQVENARTASSGTATSFLVFGLFSIVAGAMLIVGIFTMLAEERKGEMGMLRAIGLRRRAIVLAYYFEGLIYSAGSALAGTFVGVAVGYGLMALYTTFVPNSVVSGTVILGSFTFTNTTLLASYLVGFLLTLATVTVASVRVSRLNIVRAIHDVPEPPTALRTYTYLAYLGAIVAVLGALLFLETYRGTGDVTFPILGGAMVILGAGLVVSRLVANRIAFSAVGAALLLWVGVEPLRVWVLGPDHTFGIFVVFVLGILMIVGALLLMAFNAPALARGLERLGSGRAGATPVTRLGLAHPARRPARTAMTISIFALVLFTIVVLATFTETVTGSLRDSIAAQSGGYTFYGMSGQPIPDLPASVASNGTLAPFFAAVVPLLAGVTDVRTPGSGAAPFTDRLFAAPTAATPTSSFYATNRFPFLSTLNGKSPTDVMDELSTNLTVAVVDAGYVGGSAFDLSGPHPTAGPGDTLEVGNPATGASANLTVIGVLRTQVLTGVWVNPVTATALGFDRQVGYLLTVAPGASETVAAQRVKTAYFPYGLVLYSFADVLATTIALTSGEIGLLEVFIGLGLAVGIAALGILALRAVSERRHEIGTVRATGMTRGMVLRTFLLEYSFVTLLGAGIGGALGILSIYNLATGPSADSVGITGLYVPWVTILLVMVLTGLLATLAVIGPSLQAARLPPAQAIRRME